MIRALGAYSGPTPIYDYNGTLIDPSVAATAAQCLPFQCGAQPNNIAAKLWCAFWGFAGARSSCTDPACGPYRPAYCAPQASAAPAVVQTAAAPAPAGGGGGATGSGTGGAGGSTPVTVETPTGPILMPAAALPAVSDTLSAMMVRIPNIWDSLDPSKMSQFAYRGISTSFPVWISQQYRDSLATPAPDTSMGPGDVPWWVWLVIGGAAYYFSGKAPARRRRKVGGHGK